MLLQKKLAGQSVSTKQFLGVFNKQEPDVEPLVEQTALSGQSESAKQLREEKEQV